MSIPPIESPVPPIASPVDLIASPVDLIASPVAPIASPVAPIASPVAPITSLLCPDNQKFQFTRHAMSCNNIDYGKLGGKDFEPSITQYGIKNSIEFSSLPNNKISFTSEHVYVSNLLRTWITSFLLYGIHTSELHLYISPYLKEKHGTFQRGNYPKEFRHTLIKFLKAINKIKKKNNTQNFSGEVIIHLPPTGNLSQEIKLINGLEYTFATDINLCDIVDTCGPNVISNLEKTQFLQTGNLQQFMIWFNSPDNYYGKKCEKSIAHVVTHSQVMQSYLRDVFNLNIDYKEKSSLSSKLTSFFSKPPPPHPPTIEEITTKKYENVRHSNSWRFITKEIILLEELVDVGIEGFQNKYNNKIPLLIPGVPMDETTAKDLESEELNQSLCGLNGSTDVEIVCSNSNGGKKTRRKMKKNKTKRRKSRKSRPSKKK